ncbi:MAG TPA: hypothetical protein VNX01_09095 [Bacteroidia bacterium]|jgi:hypothetical protein|nr:hypothetical protein [Bacteroidia bacterium]
MEITKFYLFLHSLPSSIKSKIDWEELYIPNSYEVLLMNELAECLNKHIILYKKDYQSIPDSPPVIKTILFSSFLILFIL